MIELPADAVGQTPVAFVAMNLSFHGAIPWDSAERRPPNQNVVWCDLHARRPSGGITGLRRFNLL